MALFALKKPLLTPNRILVKSFWSAYILFIGTVPANTLNKEDYIPMFSLKVVSDEKGGGQEVGSINRYWPGTVALGTLFDYSVAAILYSMYLRFRRVHVKK